jgi:type IV secretion system protein TrbL
MKKRIFLIPVLLCVAGPVFSQSILAAIADHNFKLLDLPLVNGMQYFFSAMPYFIHITRYLGTFLGFTTIIWNSFRLWAGTVEVKKAVIDIIMKILLFTVLINVYPAISDFVLAKSTEFGIHAGNGFSTVYSKFVEYRERMENIQKAGEAQLNYLKTGEVRVTSDVAEALAMSVYMDQDKVNEFMANANIPETTIAARNTYSIAMGTNTQIANAQVNENLDNNIRRFYNTVQSRRKELFVDENELETAATILNAMDEVFSENPQFYDPENSLPGNTNKIPKYIMHPYMSYADGTPTQILSPSAVIKIGVVIAAILQTRMNDYFDENSKIMQTQVLFFKTPTLTGLMHILFAILMVITFLAAVCFYVIQYVMCIFEYAIVVSMGALFISFCLFDGTKNFTAKLVTLFSSYFIKIMTMNFCLFWVLGTFVDAGSTIMMSAEPGSMLNFAYFLFTIILSFTVTQHGPAIAVTLLNGSPQLSMGEFLHAAGTLAAGAVLARKAAGATVGAARMAGGAAQAGVRTAQTGAAMFTGAAQAASGLNLKGSERARYIAGNMGAMLLASGKERLGEMATGNKGKLAEDEKNTMARVGGGQNPKNKNVNGSQSYNDAVEGAKNFAENNRSPAQSNGDKAPPAPQPPASPSSGQNRRVHNERKAPPPGGPPKPRDSPKP